MTGAEGAALRALLSDFGLFWTRLLGRAPRAYQLAPARAVLDSVLHRRGRIFTVMFARQMGKNELSAALEAYLLLLYQRLGGSLVKAAPTWRPQVINSMLRLDGILEELPLTAGRWRSREGFIRELGACRVYFFSGQPSAQIVGATASLLLEVDEAQDFDADKYAKDLRPMGATGNATTVLFGTTWDGATLLEQVAATNRLEEARDGVRRHFAADWREGAAANPLYAAYVAAEEARMGAEHPLFQTQYLLQSVAGAGRLFAGGHLAQLAGTHARELAGAPGGQYVAGLDLAGEEEREEHLGEFEPFGRRDAAVLTVARVMPTVLIAGGVSEPQLELVQHYAWTGRKHRELIPQLVDLLKRVWGVRHLVVDATGIGSGIAAYLVGALGAARCTAFVFSAVTKSRLGYGLLGAVNAGRVRMYAEPIGSAESDAFWAQVRAARYATRAHQGLSFYVDPAEGHDDFLMSLALTVEAAGVTPYRRAQQREVPRGTG